MRAFKKSIQSLLHLWRKFSFDCSRVYLGVLLCHCVVKAWPEENELLCAGSDCTIGELYCCFDNGLSHQTRPVEMKCDADDE